MSNVHICREIAKTNVMINNANVPQSRYEWSCSDKIKEWNMNLQIAAAAGAYRENCSSRYSPQNCIKHAAEHGAKMDANTRL